MKSFIAFAALVAIAVASPVVKPVSSDLAQLEAIVAAILSPSTDPATAALLEQQLQDIIDASNPQPIAVGPAIIPEPISVGPAIIKPEYEPISVGPAWIDAPIDAPIVPSPVVIGEIADGAPAPLVQIIVNVNPAAGESAPIVPAPVTVPEVAPTPVQVVDLAPPAPIAVHPIGVVEVAPTPVQVIEAAPVPVEPVVIGTPIIPSPAVVLPEDLN